MRGKLFEGSRDDWLALRDTKIGASEIGTVMGVNPYESLSALIKRKKSGKRKADNAYMARGRELEPRLIEVAKVIYPGVGRAGECRYTEDLIVTFDALMHGSVPVEIKTTDAKNHARWIEHGPPPWYIAQVQAQCWMAESTHGQLLCAFIESGRISDIRFVEVAADHGSVEAAVAKWRLIYGA